MVSHLAESLLNLKAFIHIEGCRAIAIPRKDQLASGIDAVDLDNMFCQIGSNSCNSLN